MTKVGPATTRGTIALRTHRSSPKETAASTSIRSAVLLLEALTKRGGRRADTSRRRCDGGNVEGGKGFPQREIQNRLSVSKASRGRAKSWGSKSIRGEEHAGSDLGIMRRARAPGRAPRTARQSRDNGMVATPGEARRAARDAKYDAGDHRSSRAYGRSAKLRALREVRPHEEPAF